jgi:DNA-directed RNA polymerase alpha subunit
MNIESNGGLPPERILQEAAKILNDQLKEFKKQLKVEVK